MNLKLSTVTSSETVIPNLHILLERNSQGNAMIATVLELPNCHAEALTREQTLEELNPEREDHWAFGFGIPITYPSFKEDIHKSLNV